jgi:hypothetical protein
MLCHRRRGRLDPDRRGAHAADHLGPVQDRSELYVTVDKLIPEIEAEHFTLDEKQRNVTLTDEGNEFMERRCGRPACCPTISRFTIPNRRRWCITSTRACARTSCSPATRITSCATTRWC